MVLDCRTVFILQVVSSRRRMLESGFTWCVHCMCLVLHLVKLTSCRAWLCLKCHTANGVLKRAASVKMHASAALVSALGVMLACVALSFMSPGGSAVSSW